MFWLTRCTIGFRNLPAVETKIKKKCPDIPVLYSYRGKPKTEFWKKFPKYYPGKNFSAVKGGVNKKRLQRAIQNCWFDWDCHQRYIAKKVEKIFRAGAKTELVRELPTLKCRNARSVFENGEMITDTIGAWVTAKIVAGPFAKPPFRNFRTNALMAVSQRDKVRLVMNLSTPKGDSFNDAVAEEFVQKLEMSSARLFGH
jgi:hypothetical protein